MILHCKRVSFITDGCNDCVFVVYNASTGTNLDIYQQKIIKANKICRRKKKGMDGNKN